MPVTSRSPLNPLDLLGAAFSSPLFSLLIALVIAGAVAIVTSRPALASARDLSPAPRPVRARYAPEHRALGIVAIVVVIVFIAELVIRGYILTGSTLWWWRFAVPLICAVVGIGVILALIVTRGTTPPEAPVTSVRRSWLSFSSGWLLLTTGVAVLALLATTVAAGIASSPNGEGQYVWLTIPIPNEADIDPIRLPFYGWTFGLPVLVCLACLVVAAWATLDRNAARPYLRPETVSVERVSRRETARGTTLIVTAAVLLVLAGAWRLIASAGSGAYLTITGQNGDAPYDASWRFAEFAVAAGWCAPLLEVTAFTFLLVVAATGLRRKPAPRDASSNTAVQPNAEAVL